MLKLILKGSAVAILYAWGILAIISGYWYYTIGAGLVLFLCLAEFTKKLSIMSIVMTSYIILSFLIPGSALFLANGGF